MAAVDPTLSVRGLRKSFTLHLQGGVTIPVLDGLDLDLRPGECLVPVGPSGAGKSTLLKLLYGSYRALAGSIRILHDGRMVELVGAEPRLLLEVRRRTLGYVSQFLRVIPRVPALDVVAEPLVAAGAARAEARDRAAELLTRLNIPERLWQLPPATFSGGEQQRINVARGLAHPYPVLLLDEPTASLDAANREAVVGLITEARARGAALLGIFHDAEVRDAVATRRLTSRPRPFPGGRRRE
jgi:alpha-D-ribose 1-methylphosphonate 5-triphosphate synthase subunit PhnL